MAAGAVERRGGDMRAKVFGFAAGFQQRVEVAHAGMGS